MKKKREGDGVVGEEEDSERRHQSVYIWGEQIGWAVVYRSNGDFSSKQEESVPQILDG